MLRLLEQVGLSAKAFERAGLDGGSAGVTMRGSGMISGWQAIFPEKPLGASVVFGYHSVMHVCGGGDYGLVDWDDARPVDVQKSSRQSALLHFSDEKGGAGGVHLGDVALATLADGCRWVGLVEALNGRYSVGVRWLGRAGECVDICPVSPEAQDSAFAWQEALEVIDLDATPGEGIGVLAPPLPNGEVLALGKLSGCRYLLGSKAVKASGRNMEYSAWACRRW